MKLMKLLKFNMKRFNFDPGGHKKKKMKMFMMKLLFNYAGNNIIYFTVASSL